jgi:hypothetical protein
MEMDIKELHAKFDKYVDVLAQQRAYDLWAARGMPVGGQGAGTNSDDQVKFKFFD